MGMHVCCHPTKYPETAFCDDGDIEEVSRADAVTDAYKVTQRTSRRRLQGATRSQAGQAHEVREHSKYHSIWHQVGHSFAVYIIVVCM